ncbi:MAG: type II toxin-antitoxin system Phd/YefM family antitoxin [Chloroflexota bacterium]|nr:MAG: type II toxin-antitoxin system Phd/YefM family antitoxin [Chloroflexota bacterium]
MTSMSTAEARDQFSDVVNRAAYAKERIVLTRRGKPFAAVVPIEDLELIERLEDEVDIRDAEAALKEAEEKGTIPLEQLAKELGL